MPRGSSTSLEVPRSDPGLSAAAMVLLCYSARGRRALRLLQHVAPAHFVRAPSLEVHLAINPIATLEKQRLDMTRNLV